MAEPFRDNGQRSPIRVVSTKAERVHQEGLRFRPWRRDRLVLRELPGLAATAPSGADGFIAGDERPGRIMSVATCVNSPRFTKRPKSF